MGHGRGTLHESALERHKKLTALGLSGNTNTTIARRGPNSGERGHLGAKVGLCLVLEATAFPASKIVA
jgi:hypothetical protein